MPVDFERLTLPVHLTAIACLTESLADTVAAMRHLENAQGMDVAKQWGRLVQRKDSILKAIGLHQSAVDSFAA
jgi:hypothetical protein